MATPIVSDRTVTARTVSTDRHIAVIGLAGRFPGADDVDALWAMLKAGRSGLVVLDGDGSEAATGPDATQDRPGPVGRLVRRAFRLPHADCFDAAFFGIPAAEAAAMDPQQRVFLEVAWHALEHAGHGDAGGRGDAGPVGVFAGCGFNDHVLKHVGPRSYRDGAADYFAMLLGNDKDFLASRVAYHLGLQGPAVVVQSACSSALLAVHVAVQSLLAGETDMALAGGASICLDLEDGYAADEGGALSPSGRIAPFGHDADGIVGGNGAAAVVLKRLADAERDGDTIHAVIEATVANNDGRLKAGFTAPSAAGQARALAEALGLSGRDAGEIGFVETHGTGTPLGDPIELEALTQVYGGAATPCRLGSIKANVGHLNAAAGIAGLIAAVLVVRDGVVPPLAGHRGTDPRLGLAATRFRIATAPETWRPEGPRVAAVSSFGFGGTNVHAIVSEPPTAREPAAVDAPHLLGWSARTPEDLAALDAAMAAHWTGPLAGERPDTLADQAATLALGRRAFPHRHAVVAASAAEAGRAVATGAVLAARVPGARRDPVFLFPGQGSQFPGMCAWLHATHAPAREIIDEAAALLAPTLGCDLRSIVFGDDEAALRRTLNTQLALFVVSYAQARPLVDAGLRPAALLGHSIGEYVAACVAGVMSFRDALTLVAARGRLVASLPPAAMLAVGLPEGELGPLLGEDLSIAVVAAPDRCVVAGDGEAIARLETALSARDVPASRLRVSHAFHSHRLEPILDRFAEALATIRLARPTIPLVSNASGALADPDAVATPDYWVRHLRAPVRLHDGFSSLASAVPDALALELGPGATLCGLARKCGAAALADATPTMRSAATQRADFLAAMGKAWVEGCAVAPELRLGGPPRRRVPLPLYPFRRTPHRLPLLAAAGGPAVDALAPDAASPRRPPEKWCHVPVWSQHPGPFTNAPPWPEDAVWFLPDGLSPPTGAGGTVVRPGREFRRLADGSFRVRPDAAADHRALVDALAPRGARLGTILHAWLLDDTPTGPRERRALGYGSLVRLAQAIDAKRTNDIVGPLVLMTRRLAAIQAGEPDEPVQAAALGALHSIAVELAVRTAWLDVDALPDPTLLRHLLATRPDGARPVALAVRQGRAWRRSLAPVTLAAAGPPAPGGTWLVIGGLGGIGSVLLPALAGPGSRIVVVGRSIDPDVVATPARHPVLKACLDRGARVTAWRGDAADRALLGRVAADLAAQPGRLDGVFQLAGLYVNQTLADLSLAETDSNFRAKIEATLMLRDVLAPLRPGFLALFSSITAEISGVGVADYAAANRGLDAIAAAEPQPFPIVSIAWDAWRDVGALGRALAGTDDSGLFARDIARAITPSEGLDTLWRILTSGLRRVLVCTGDIDARRREIDALAARRDAPIVLPSGG
ncbi:SDR family NAD(P)-dependent oxidoreductase, partial [Rhodoplanes tepidamans]